MHIVLGSDHAGYDLKKFIQAHLEDKGHICTDVGHTSADQAASYVEFGPAVARFVTEGKADFGIVVCGTGIGISIAANKIAGVRAALCTNEFMARMARKHNDSNVLALGARVVAPQFACSIVDAYIEEAFEGGRHQVRVDELCALDD